MTWTQETLSQTLEEFRSRRGDTTSIEVKKASGGMPQNLGETLCAFANMPSGGTIILGVDEKENFAITGISDEAGLEAAIASHNRNDVHPAPYLEFETVKITHGHSENLKVLIVTVQGLPISDKPARYKSKAYLRQADGDYVMNNSELRMLAVSKLHVDEQNRYDEKIVPHSTQADFETDLVQNYLTHVKASSKRLRNLDDQDILRTTGATTAEQQLTIAGLYGLGIYPQGAEPALGATAAVQLERNGNGQRNRNLQHFDGPLPAMLEELTSWAEHNLPTVQEYSEQGHLYNRTILPMAAVREVIANALVHRDLGPDTLGTGKSVQVRITDRCLIVENPGGLRGLSKEQLLSSEHAQAAVNQRLYHLMKFVRLSDGARVIEGEGGGIREVQETIQESGAQPPMFIDTGVKFRVVLWFPDQSSGSQKVSSENAHSPRVESEASAVGWESLGKNVPLIVEVLESQGMQNRADLMKATGLSNSQVRYALKALLDGGYVVMDGEQGSKNTRYRLKNTAKK